MRLCIATTSSRWYVNESCPWIGWVGAQQQKCGRDCVYSKSHETSRLCDAIISNERFANIILLMQNELPCLFYGQ